MSTQGYVLGPTEGEQLIGNAGSISIKVDPSKGSTTWPWENSRCRSVPASGLISIKKQMRCCSF